MLLKTTWITSGSFDGYVAAKARVFERTQRACIYNVEDSETQRMVADAEVIEGCRAIGLHPWLTRPVHARGRGPVPG